MSNIAKSRGSQNLTGAAALRNRMPAMVESRYSVTLNGEGPLGLGFESHSSLTAMPCTGLSSRLR
jgi:hypothetical protein